MFEHIVISKDKAMIYYTDGREPYLITTDAGNILDVVRQLIYTNGVHTCTASKVA